MTFHWRLSLAAGIIGAVLAGCSPAPTQVSQPVDREQQARLEIEQLLQQAKGAPPIQSARLKVQAASILLGLNRRDAAYSVLADVDLEYLPPSLRFDIAQLRARSALDQQDPAQALRYLQVPPATEASPSSEQYLRLGELRAEAFRLQNDPINEAIQLIDVSRQAEDDATRQSIHDQTWRALSRLSVDQLIALSQQTGNTYFEQGWYELALIYKQSPRLDIRTNALNDWNTLWESHPARMLPPATGGATTSADPISAQRVAVLLPMQGNLAKAGAAIREGILAAYYNDRASGRPVPHLSFIDSTQANQPEALRALVSNQAFDLVIGPLEKEYVSALNSSAPLPAPVLALNYDQDAMINQVYQFGLAAEDEARQAARKAWEDGSRTVLAVVPQTNWGVRIRDAFTQEFEQLGGRVAADVALNEQEDFSQDLSRLLATDRSKERANQINRISRHKIKFEERRRTDADAIFLSALPADARQIKPILAFHFAGDLPIYATSHVYAGSADGTRDRDLNGIRFVDTPWTLAASTEAKRAISQKRTDADTRFGRLYALGADAYQLYPYLHQLAATAGAAIQGETGALSIDQNKRIIRTLQWAYFHDGVPKTLQ